ncbi:hypothetical protein CEUSTIGMA_g13262.t1 [Chlamydomonas eustigma]|uniref:Uncharacterized protein n=1 Tax=Chlamydomonas eustigma TaxID=1157962 RepID=A0A250XRY5_9CHLO|nr:hypothetical protein CEUSTIGMA_g13262.t1 [Chlamydomonas eustigma]|eukprot:GAX85847.1 hypothetical protein CEUSTIGMA_g13262.t1 [Chlamydomonas eustigma]
MTSILEQFGSLIPTDLQVHDVAALQEIIENLDAFQAKARLQLFTLLHGQVQNGGDAERVASALEPICTSSMMLSPESPEGQLIPHIQHYMTLVDQTKELEQQKRAKEDVAVVDAQVSEFNALLHAGQVLEATEYLLKMQQNVCNLQPDLYQVAQSPVKKERSQSACAVCEQQLEKVLQDAFSSALLVDAPSRQLLVRPLLLHTRVPVTQLWAALEMRGCLHTSFNTLADEVMRKVMEPLFSGGLAMLAVLHPNEQVCGPAVLQWRDLTSEQSHDPEACCQKVLQLVAEYLFDQSETWIKKWGDVFWRRMAGGICREPREPYLAPAMEALSESLLAVRQQSYLEDARNLILGTLEDKLKEGILMGLPMAVDEEYCKRLAAGKLPEWEAQDPPCGCSQEAAFLAKGQYQVSSYLPAMVELVEKVLRDAAASGDPATAQVLVGAIPKICLMARILPDRESMAQAPHLSMLYYNDLRHLADTLLLLPACYGPELAPLMSPMATTSKPLESDDHTDAALVFHTVPDFLQDALLLRSAADEVFKNQIQLHQEALGELLQGLDHMKRIGARGSAQSGLTYRKTVMQVLHSLGRLGLATRTVLAPEPFVELSTAVLSSVCAPVVEDVLAKRDIGIDDAKEIRNVLQPLAEDSLPAFLGTSGRSGTSVPAARTSSSSTTEQQQQKQQSSFSGIPVDVIGKVIQARCLSLRKLISLLNLLDAGHENVHKRCDVRGLHAKVLPSVLEGRVIN